MKDNKKLDALFKKAVELHQTSQLQDASLLYEEILKNDPKHFDALQLLATLYAHAGQLSSSLDLFSRALSINDKNPKILNNYGYVLAQSGEFATAQKMYERAVKLDPNYLDALNNLANLYQQIGEFAKSIDLYEQITLQNSDYVQAYFNMGVALQCVLRFEDAVKSYDQAIYLKPDYFDAYLNKATALKDLQKYEDAFNIYQQLLTLINGPASFEVHNNCGNLLQTMGLFEQALVHFDQAVMANPYQAVAYSNRGNVLQKLGRHQEAILSYGVALAIDPLAADFYSNRGNALQSTDSHDSALSDYTRAIELNPQHTQAYYNRGNLFKAHQQFNLAIESYAIALILVPTYSDAYNNLGNVYKELNSLDAALRSYDQAITYNPLQIDAINNKGVTLQRQLKLEQAIACFDLAIQRSPENFKSHVNKAIILFLQGKFAKAWDLYEARLNDKDLISKPLLTEKPPLELPISKDLSLLSLLIWSEQGVGDEIMFASMFQFIANCVGRLIVMVDPRLISLFQRSFPNITFVNKELEVDSSLYDFHLPMGSMGLALQLDESKMKAFKSPLLSPDLNETRELKNQLEKLSSPSPHLKTKPIYCGISWKSNNPSNGVERSIDPQYLLESIKTPGICFVNLQYPTPLNEVLQSEDQDLLASLQSIGLLSAKVDNYNELDRLASLIKVCDVVISIDNSTVHLSAALGVPTWVLLPVMPDWRWMLDRRDSPWYSSVELFRQRNWGDWLEPLRDIKTKLNHLLLTGST